MEYEYIVLEHGQKYPRDATVFGSIWEDRRMVSAVAETAAEDYWDNCIGWEATWPLTFELFRDGKSIGRYVVEMEARPEFSATKADAEKGGE